MKHRLGKVNSLIQEELGKILLREMEFEGALVTVTEAEAGKNMDTALVRVSVLPSEKSAEVLRVLSGRRNYLQNLLADKIILRPMPKIIFEIDRGLERAAEVEKLLLKDKIGE